MFGVWWGSQDGCIGVINVGDGQGDNVGVRCYWGDSNKERLLCIDSILDKTEGFLRNDIRRVLVFVTDWGVLISLICRIQIHVRVRIKQEVLAHISKV